MDVSIIIVNWNTKKVLRDCLMSVCQQTQDLDYEIIVVDNASTDGSTDMIRSDFQQVILVENPENRGFAAANNQGIAMAKGMYILLLNSDTVVCDNAIEKTVRYADSHPNVAVVGCQVWENSDTIQMTCFGFPGVAHILLFASGLSKLFKHSRILGRERMLWWDRKSEREVDVVSGMFMLVRREAIAEVGLMDEDYFLYYEETDWCYRFVKAGWKILFWPGAKIIHVCGGSQSSNQVMVEMFVQMQKSLLIFLKKHKGRLIYWLGRLILIFSFSLRVCAWAMLLAFKKIIGENVHCESAAIQKHWAAFNFCSLGVEPKSKRRRLEQNIKTRRFKDIVKFIVAALYSLFVKPSNEKPHRVVLYYHGIDKADAEGFRKQMAYLAKNCSVVEVSKIKTASVDGAKNIVAITFDDAFVSVVENAVPILREHGLPAAIFVPTDNLGQHPRWAIAENCSDKNETLMSREQVAQLDKEGFEILSHTHSHPVLTELEEDKLEAELVNSKRVLEEIISHEVTAISYPHGAYNSSVCKIARKAGYELGFTIEPAMVDYETDDLRIGRFRVLPTDSLTKFRLKVNGAYQFVSRLRKMTAQAF